MTTRPINQVLVVASPGDAITNAALEVREILRRLGPSDIFARHIEPGIAHEVFALELYDERHQPPNGQLHDDLLIYHASIGDPVVHEFVSRCPARLVLIYHNMSPAEAFAKYEPSFADMLVAGRRDLAHLRDRTTLALAVSAFNAAELVELGFHDVRVAPLIIDPTALHEVEPDEATANHLSTHVEGPVVLSVGQILPHKRPDLLVQAFHVLVTYLVPDANLIMVGSQRLPRFCQAVQDQIAELGLHRAWLAGAVSRGSLRSFYERADAFVTASDHEGFCVPLVEAWSFELPVVARATTVIPETLGDAGLLVAADDSPIVLAEAIAEVLSNTVVCSELVSRGNARLACFDPEAARETLLSHLLSVM